MQNIKLDATLYTPYINFDFENGSLEIRGKSIPEDSHKFYNPLISLVEEYSNNPKKETTALIHLTYFNTSSSKQILEIFRNLEKIYKAGNNLCIKWFYETDDEDTYEAGEDYKSFVSIPFEIVEIKA